MRRTKHFASALQSLGGRCGLKYYFADRVLSNLGGETSLYKLQPPQSAYPLFLRAGTSDRDVFRQVFIEGEYDLIPPEAPPVRTVLDCGANVGITTAYFATIFPDARLFAIEPDPSNFELLQKNSRPFRDRVYCLNTGVWSHRVGLKVESGSYRDGREWATRVRPVSNGEDADLQAMSIQNVMQEHSLDAIDFLKIDVEGSEEALFGQGYQQWLSSVRMMMVELHGDEAESSLAAALSDVPFSFRSKKFNETTFLIRE
jgi:FkbM family methyltransferase